MATLLVSQNGKAIKGSSHKQAPGVDLTAMVDLAFLLITFFMLTTSLSKMNAMDIAKPIPVTKEIDLAPWPASKTLTILLGKNNKVAYYMGQAKEAKIETSFTANVANVILLAKEKVDGKDLYVIVKPTSNAVYKNFVDVMDDLNITNIKTYAIDDKYILDEEKGFMASKRM